MIFNKGAKSIQKKVFSINCPGAIGQAKKGTIGRNEEHGGGGREEKR
jgi:hypothetical protein